jgi:hypothetical protein
MTYGTSDKITISLSNLEWCGGFHAKSLKIKKTKRGISTIFKAQQVFE